MPPHETTPPRLAEFTPRDRVFVFFAGIAGNLVAQSRIKAIKLGIENPTDATRDAEDIVISIADLRSIAPDFTPGSVIVTATDARTLAEDLVALQTVELLSQVDAFDDHKKADELVFQIDLKPRQTRIVTISYGEVNQIWRLRADYPKRTAALFAKKIEGVGWESERNAWRLYFDQRNAIDLFGKRRPSLQVEMFASPEFIYNAESPEGRDIFRVGPALGIGAFGAWIDGKLVKVSDVKDREWQIVSSGPVRSVVDLTYSGWNAGGRSLTLHSRITQWAGERGFEHVVHIVPDSRGVFATGLPLKPSAAPIKSDSGGPVTWLATWGEQVVNPGPAEADFVRGHNLGVAVLTTTPGADFEDDAKNHFITFHLDKGRASWYALAAWDQEGTNRLKFWSGQKRMGTDATYVPPPDGITTRDAFLIAVRRQAERKSHPVKVTILSSSVSEEQGPLDTAAPLQSKSYQQAIELLRQEIDRTAAKWVPGQYYLLEILLWLDERGAPLADARTSEAAKK